MAQYSPLESRWRWVLVLVGASAFVFRLVVALSLWTLPEGYLLNGDLFHYHQYALYLSGHGQASLEGMIYFSPLAIAWGTVCHAPGGPSIWAVVGPQILLGTGGALLIASVGRRLGGALAGLVSGLLAALCEPFAVYDAAILPTSLALFLGALAVWMTLWAVRKEGLRRCALYGLVVGAWITCRPNAALFVPVAMGIVWAASRTAKIGERIRGPAVLLAVAALTVLPVTIVNTARTGAFVPVTSAAGVNLFIGNNQGANGHAQSVFGERNALEAYTIFSEKASRVAGRNLDPTEVSNFWTKATWAEIADAPGRFAVLLGKKLLYGLNDFPIGDSWNLPYLETEAAPLMLPWPGFGLMLTLGLLGLIVLWRRQVPGTRAVHGVAAMSFLTLMIFFVADRYRTPLAMALCIASGPAVAWFVEQVGKVRRETEDRIRKAAATRLAGAALLIALSATITHLPILKVDFGLELDRMAKAYLAEGNKPEAIERLKRLRRLHQERGDMMSAQRTQAAILRLSQ